MLSGLLLAATLSRRTDYYEPLACWADRETKQNRRGYILVFAPEHPRSFCGGWVYEHRLVMEAHLGRLLRKNETVHHINECKTQNILDNLFVCNEREHLKAHGWAYVA